MVVVGGGGGFGVAWKDDFSINVEVSHDTYLIYLT